MRPSGSTHRKPTVALSRNSRSSSSLGGSRPSRWPFISSGGPPGLAPTVTGGEGGSGSAKSSCPDRSRLASDQDQDARRDGEDVDQDAQGGDQGNVGGEASQ